MKLESFSHSYGQLTYHVVLVPKYRRKIFAGSDIRKGCEHAIKQIAAKYHFEIHALEVMPDHVHLFVGCKPTMSMSKTVQLFKGISARLLFQHYPEIKYKLWGGHLWSRGTFIRSVGNVTADTVQHYIQ